MALSLHIQRTILKNFKYTFTFLYSDYKLGKEFVKDIEEKYSYGNIPFFNLDKDKDLYIYKSDDHILICTNIEHLKLELTLSAPSGVLLKK